MTRAWSLRARLTTIAVVITTVGLVIAAAAIVAVLDSSLFDELERSLDARADDISEQIDSTNEEIVVGPGITDDSFAAVISTDGSFFAASDERFGFVEDIEAILDVSRFDGTFDLSLPSLDLGEDDPYLAVAHLFDIEPFATGVAIDDVGDEDYVTIVATSTSSVERTLSRVTLALMLGVPALVAAIGFLVWWLAGRALRPVEAIRSDVEQIGASALDRRVPEPERLDEIGKLAVTMNSMLDRLETAESQQRQFIADASHELRSPLAALGARLDVETRHGDESTAAAALPAISADVTRLRGLVDDLLTLARNDARSGGPITEHTLVDLDDLVFAVVADVGSNSSPLRIDVSGVSAGTVRGETSHLRRVVQNLLDNATTHAHDAVRVALREAGSTVVLTVDDDGNGVDPDQRERIFERFVRLDSARARDTGGSGLGLAIVRELVEQHGGSVVVADAPSGGARFEVTLPAA